MSAATHTPEIANDAQLITALANLIPFPRSA